MKKLTFFLFIFINSLQAQYVGFNWARSIYGLLGADCRPIQIELDNNGNIYTYGVFLNTADFDPGPGTFTMYSLGFAPYITKYDNAGNFIWAKHFKNPAFQATWTGATQIRIDNAGNVYCVGTFGDQNDFDPGPGTFTMNTTLGSGYIVKLDVNGNLVWAEQIGDGGTTISNIQLDNLGNVFIAGIFSGPSADFDPGPGTYTLGNYGANNTQDVFVAKIDPNGALLWVKQIGGLGNEGVISLQKNAIGNVVLCGKFSQMVDFDPSPATYTLNAQNGAAFICEINSTGNFVNAWQYGNSSTSPHSMVLDGNQNVIVYSRYFGTTDFDPGVGTYTLANNNTVDYAICKYSSNGSFIWAMQAPNNASGPFNRLEIGIQNSVLCSGIYAGLVDFDPSVGTYTLQTSSSADGNGFICRYDANGNFGWVREIAGPNDETVADFYFDMGGGNVFVTGQFMNGSDLDPGPGVYNINTQYIDPYILKLGPCNPPVQPNVSSQTTFSVCGIGSFILNANSTDSLRWKNNANSNSYIGSGPIYATGTLSAGNYSYYAVATNTCAESFPPALYEVSVFPVPVINISPSKTIYCYGESVTLTPSGAVNYNMGSVFFTGSTVVTPTGNTVYSITGGDINGCYNTSTIVLIMDQCTGISENQKQSGIIIWPNPSSGNFEVDLQNLSLVEIFNTAGQLVFRKAIESSDSKKIESKLSSGLYLMKLQSSDGSWAERKIVIDN